MKRIIALLLCFIFILPLSSCREAEEGTPKYVFMFVGDGMGMSAVSLTEYAGIDLSFNDFDTFGLVTTHNLSSEITDSASAATAFSSGEKTKSHYVGLDGNGKKVKTLTDFFKARGMKVGLVSSQAVNHATPAAFYAHNKSRYNYYEIGLDFCESRIDLFAGAGFLEPDGEEGNLYELSKGKTVTAEEGYLPFEIDRAPFDRSLSDYLELTVEELYSEDGFFIMCEGGRIDSACHMNDAYTALCEIEAFDDAVKVALEFYEEHPQDTLIIVTADHETGGLTLGYNVTEYEMYPEVLSKQKISYSRFENEYVSAYREKQPDLDSVMGDIAYLFGLGDLTSYEKELLSHAYELTKAGTGAYTTRDWVDFSDKTPLTVQVLRILSHRAGIDFTTFYHTATPVGLWAKGAKAHTFGGAYDNTDIYEKIVEVCS